LRPNVQINGTEVVDGKVLQLNISNLQPFRKYSFVVEAVYTAGDQQSNISNPFSRQEIALRTEEDAPTGAPLNTSVSKVLALNATVAWALPAAAERNGIITGYRVSAARASTGHEYADATITDPEFVDLAADISAHTFDSLQSHVNYTFSVRARTRVGLGPAASVSARTLESRPEGVPQITQVVPDGEGALRVDWEPMVRAPRRYAAGPRNTCGVCGTRCCVENRLLTMSRTFATRSRCICGTVILSASRYVAFVQ